MRVDLVSHGAKKFFLPLMKKNGYVLEQLYSPLIVQTSDAHAELKKIARGCSCAGVSAMGETPMLRKSGDPFGCSGRR